MQPIRDNQIYWIYVFCAFMLIGQYFCLQLFIGSITTNFERSRKKLGGLVGMTKAQQEWVQTQLIMKAIKPKVWVLRPKSFVMGILYDVTTHRAFDLFFTVIIILQYVVLSMKYFGQDDAYSNVLESLEVALTVIFALEMVVKLISLTVKVYFQELWNRVDCAIVLCSVGVLLNSVITGASNRAVQNVVRVLRIIRLLRVLRSLESLQILLETVALTIPGVINVSMLVLLTVYIFSVVCVQLFSKTAYNHSYNEDANFRTFGIAFTVLYRFLTGDNWGQFVVDLTKNTPDCVNDPPYNASYCGFNDQPGCIPLNGCGSIVAYPVLVLFMLFTTLVLLSVFVSIIISNYSAVKKSPIKTTEFDLFAEHWSKLDPRATRYIPYDLLFPLVTTMSEPFGFEGKKCSRRLYGKRVSEVKVSKDRKVFFNDVLAVLSKAHFVRNRNLKGSISQRGIPSNTTEQSSTASDTVLLTMKKSVSTSSDSPFEHDDFTVAHYLAADLIWQAWGRWKQSRNVTVGGSMPSLCFYERNLRALTKNEELQEIVCQFIKHNEDKASSIKTLPNKNSTEVNQPARHQSYYDNEKGTIELSEVYQDNRFQSESRPIQNISQVRAWRSF
jgi:hypothetical protein